MLCEILFLSIPDFVDCGYMPHCLGQTEHKLILLDPLLGGGALLGFEHPYKIVHISDPHLFGGVTYRQAL